MLDYTHLFKSLENFGAVNVSNVIHSMSKLTQILTVHSKCSSQGQRLDGCLPRQLRNNPRRQEKGSRVQVSGFIIIWSQICLNTLILIVWEQRSRLRIQRSMCQVQEPTKLKARYVFVKREEQLLECGDI